MTFYAVEYDEDCDAEEHKAFMFDGENSVQSEKYWYTAPNVHHDWPFYMDCDTVIPQLVAAIETGDVERASEFPTSFCADDENLFYNSKLDSELYYFGILDLIFPMGATLLSTTISVSALILLSTV